ncbi:MAG: 4a-hydroxytetrahydrobiopterin dehydratase [Leifsonia sp.]
MSSLEPSDTADDLAGTAFEHGDGVLTASYSTRDFASAVRLLDAVAVVADELDHHPDVLVGYGSVVFELSSHDVGGVTGRDVRLARRIEAIAEEQGATRAS